MRYVSLDIETTGLDPKQDQILQLAMVVEDTTKLVPVEELPYFSVFVKHERITGNAFALGMNAWILDIISGRKEREGAVIVQGIYHLEQLGRDFLKEHFPDGQRINVAGKNVAGFDLPFLPTELKRPFRHRVIDPGSVFVDWSKEMLPALGDLISTEVSHDALGDARDVITCLRRSYT